MPALFSVEELVSQTYIADETKYGQMLAVVDRALELSKDPGFPPGIDAITIVPMILLGGDIEKIMHYEEGKHGSAKVDEELIERTMKQFIPLFN